MDTAGKYPVTESFSCSSFLCQQMKKISSSILLSSRSCWVLWGRGPPGVSLVRLTDLGAVWAGLCCDALRMVVLHCSGAETGLKISNNSTREKSNLKKNKNLFSVFFVVVVAVALISFSFRGFFVFAFALLASTACFKGWIDTGYIYEPCREATL